MIKRSNCYITAWKAYASGDAVWMACRKSWWSKLDQLYRRPFLRPAFVLIAAIGTILLWSATAVWLMGPMLRFGTWPHWVFCKRINSDCLEAVPAESEKEPHFLPPVIFKAKVRKVNESEAR